MAGLAPDPHLFFMKSPALSSDLWWMNAVFYCLDVETYLDSDGNGHGDFQGLTKQLGYIRSLGVTCIWLMPFYPSPNRDDGYDVADYYGVDLRLGTLGDFVVMLREARDQGLRVIIDLVVNHTSDQHPWFREARSDRESAYRDFYVWRDEPIEDEDLPLMFPEVEDSVWSWDDQAGQYYLHHFYSHQPDLNVTNPAVWAEIEKIAGYWLELGVDGFRVDAVPLVLATGGLTGDIDLDPHDLLVDLRSFAQRRRGGVLLLGEVDLPPGEGVEYFGSGTELNMLFNFPLNQALYLALARRDAQPLLEAIDATPDPPSDSQWATFVRNHDELNLGQLSDAEREEVFEAFGPEDHMQIFGRGLRRRLPSMLDGDEGHIRLVYSLLFTLPGAPVIFYGEEIGMSANLDIPGRLSVRTPMQWAPGESGGFSEVDPTMLCRPFPEGEYGPSQVNVADQLEDPESLLSWMKSAIAVRRQTPEFGWGKPEVIQTSHPQVLAHRCGRAGQVVVAVHNLDAETHTVRIEPGDGPRRFEVILGGDEVFEVQDAAISMELEPHGFRWLRGEVTS
ncbi:alpha-amylase family protein [soil metagenome]